MKTKTNEEITEKVMKILREWKNEVEELQGDDVYYYKIPFMKVTDEQLNKLTQKIKEDLK